jgi:hypothetical protein
VTFPLANNGVTPPAPLGVDKIPDAQTALNVTTAAVVKASPGRLVLVSVIVAGSAVGSASDAAAVADVAAGNQIATIPNTVGVYDVDWPCLAGIVVTPGTGQTVAVAYY